MMFNANNLTISPRLSWAAIMALSLVLTMVSGCRNTPENNDIAWIQSVYNKKSHAACSSHNQKFYAYRAKPTYNTNFIFDTPPSARPAHYVSSEDFGRNPWPVSPEATRNINSSTSGTYREYSYSTQYLSSNGNSHISNRTHQVGYRTGTYSN